MNLGIDPDTHAGITRNVVVWLEDIAGDWVRWKYNPLRDLEDEGFSSQKILVLFFQNIEASQFEPRDCIFQGDRKRDHHLIAPFAEDEDIAMSNAVDCTVDADFEMIGGNALSIE